MTLKIELPLPPSQNQLLRMHWAKRRELKKFMAWDIVSQKKHTPGLPWRRAAVLVTRRSCGKEPDPDNLTAANKLILDALQDAGVILDDAPEFITLVTQWERVPTRKAQGVTVAITKVSNEKTQTDEQ